MKILILEDNTFDADLTKRGLTSSIPHCEIDVAHIINKGRDFISEKQYDVALLDMQLPDGNGLDLLSEIRQKNLDMAIIIL
ncbi:MAG: response regulator, partial [Bacteroidales bacterium]|nr:response regulator [Bacteroidales bacterium]